MAGEVKGCYTSPELTYGTDKLQEIKKKKNQTTKPGNEWERPLDRSVAGGETSVTSSFLQNQKDSFITQLSTRDLYAQ